ncbi:MAG: hypothetical protein J2P17_18810 [Mycobacterium sp.]|nr:hypothetical protein [Mycobacterium sp.]
MYSSTTLCAAGTGTRYGNRPVQGCSCPPGAARPLRCSPRPRRTGRPGSPRPWLITLSIVAGLTAFELLVGTLDTGLARVGRSLYLVGGALGLASITYDLGVTSTLLGEHPVPDSHFGVRHWADGLATAYFALLAPAAMGLRRAHDPADPSLAAMDRMGVPRRFWTHCRE